MLLLNYRYLLACVLLWVNAVSAQPHPNIMITQKHIADLRENIEKYPLLKQSYATVKASADIALKQPINVPVPKDDGGGITHEQHKKNYATIFNCGITYQITKDQKYATYIKDILLQYAAQYQKWPLHPKGKSSNEAGKIFWQSLNDFVWQVYVIQGYDMVYDALSAKDRTEIENNLFIPLLKFFTQDRAATFNKIHNHGTWCLAAVGLTGYVLNKPEYVEMALKGSNKDGKTGYWAQLNRLFSPDGYYAEGPYYQRYAMFPFILFAKAIHNYQPELHVFEYRNKILAKAIATSLQTTYTNGVFFPINDAIKDKTFESSELVYALNIIYADVSPQPDLLDVAQRQRRVTVSDAGLEVAKAVYEKKAIPFKYISQWLSDGADGKEGGLGILRSGPNTDQQCTVLKATSQGMEHGHFDRLNLLYYDNGGEIFCDYGAARFLNIESKGGGGYLPENKSWAKQTVAHNTVVVDRSSDFNANLSEAEKYHPDLVYFKITPELQVICAEDDHAYADVKLNRVIAFITVPELSKPLLVDVFKVDALQKHTYDLPFWYKGQMVDASFKMQAYTDELKPFGKGSGYQHLWLNAQHPLIDENGYITLINNKRFYTTHFTCDNPLTINFVSTGANDPNMNIVESKAFMLSAPAATNTTFACITETHGIIDTVNETVANAQSSISGITIKNISADKKVISFQVKNKQYQLEINYKDKDHFIKLN